MAKVILNNVRLAFPHLFKLDNNGKYSSALIVERGSESEKKINAAIEQVAKEKWAAKAESIIKALKAGNKICFTDGDAKAEYDGFAGNMSLSAGSAVRPTVVGKNKTPLTEADGVIYAGCYVNAVVDVWPQDNEHGKRVNAKLLGIQFFADGDSFTGGAALDADDFDDISEGSDAEDFV